MFSYVKKPGMQGLYFNSKPVRCGIFPLSLLSIRGFYVNSNVRKTTSTLIRKQ